MFESGSTYNSIYFSGAGYFLPYHLGVVKCLRDNDIYFNKTFGISSGGLAAFAMLGAADLDLTIRQIFDLPKQGFFFGWDYMFKILISFFEKSRKNNKMTLEEINGRFNIGLLNLKNFSKYFKNTFTSEEDLSYSVVLSANVTPFISLSPACYQEGIFVDPLMVDPIIEEGIDLAVTPFGFNFHLPHAKKIINGDQNLFYLLYPCEETMKNSFFKGYADAKGLIKPSLTIKGNRMNSKQIFYDIMERKKNWKRETGFLVKEKTKKGKMKDVEICVPENSWDIFLKYLKTKKWHKLFYPLLLSFAFCWIIMKIDNI